MFCNLHAYSANFQYMEDTGRSKIQNFGVLGVSGLKGVSGLNK